MSDESYDFNPEDIIEWDNLCQTNPNIKNLRPALFISTELFWMLFHGPTAVDIVDKAVQSD
jgi:hypothetical protein